MRIGIAADHGGFYLKEKLSGALRSAGHQLSDFGPERYDAEDDYPDFIIPLARAVSRGEMERGVAVCGSGIGACVAANKVDGVRAATIFDTFSARQGVEDDDMNVICLLPTETIDAYRDHGDPEARLSGELDAAYQVLDELADLGVDLADISTGKLLEEGVESFKKSFDELMGRLAKRMRN